MQYVAAQALDAYVRRRVVGSNHEKTCAQGIAGAKAEFEVAVAAGIVLVVVAGLEEQAAAAAVDEPGFAQEPSSHLEGSQRCSATGSRCYNLANVQLSDQVVQFLSETASAAGHWDAVGPLGRRPRKAEVELVKSVEYPKGVSHAHDPADALADAGAERGLAAVEAPVLAPAVSHGGCSNPIHARSVLSWRPGAFLAR